MSGSEGLLRNRPTRADLPKLFQGCLSESSGISIRKLVLGQLSTCVDRIGSQDQQGQSQPRTALPFRCLSHLLPRPNGPALIPGDAPTRLSHWDLHRARRNPPFMRPCLRVPTSREPEPSRRILRCSCCQRVICLRRRYGRWVAGSAGVYSGDSGHPPTWNAFLTRFGS